MATLTLKTTTSTDPVAEAEQTLRRAEAGDTDALTALNHLRAADETGNPWTRPTGRELQDARHQAQVASRARKAAADALDAARVAAAREAAEAARRQRRGALERYLTKVTEAAAVWPEVVAAGPVAGLAPAMAYPEGVSVFKAWCERNVP